MRRSVFIALLLALVLAAAFLVLRKRETNVSLSPAARKGEESASKQAFFKLFKEPRRISVENLIKEETDQACLDGFEEIQRLDLEALDFPPKLDALPSLERCANPPATIKKLMEDYAKNCEEFLDPFEAPASKDEWDKTFQKCVVSLMSLRSRITSFKTKDQKISEITDLHVLADRLFDEMWGLFNAGGLSQISAEGFSRMKEIAERMLELNPGLYGPARASALAAFLPAVLKKEAGKDTESEWADAMKSYERLQSFDRGDLDVQEFGLFVKTKGLSPELLPGELDAFARRTQGTGLAEYYRAWMAFKGGNAKLALDFLARAQSLNPTEARFKETAEKLRAGGAGAKDSFILKFNVKFGNADFLGR